VRSIDPVGVTQFGYSGSREPAFPGYGTAPPPCQAEGPQCFGAAYAHAVGWQAPAPVGRRDDQSDSR
ncbi:MAG: hypothetical protein AAF721_40530, partial [Myxococcota bacterium]